MGTISDPRRLLALVETDSRGLDGTLGGNLLANQVLRRFIAPCDCQLGGVLVYADGAGSGAGNTVIDLQRNGASVWAATGNRPTLAAASTGEFTNPMPDYRAVLARDRLQFVVISVPATLGHSGVYCSVGLERPGA